jgi:hypothetical protein
MQTENRIHKIVNRQEALRRTLAPFGVALFGVTVALVLLVVLAL